MRMRYVRSALWRFAVFGLLWLVLSEVDAYQWGFALVTVGLATAVSLWLLEPGEHRVRPIAALRFLGFFARQSVLGGVDVARRTLQPGLAVHPAWIDYRLRLAPGPARLMFVSLLSLLPGTVSAYLKQDHLRVHVLDRSMRVLPAIEQMERGIGAAFGQPVADGGPQSTAQR